jgi:hypothetical protein
MMRLLRLNAALTMLLVSASCAQPGPVAGGEEPPADVASSTFPRPPRLGPSELPPAMRPNVAVPDERVTELRPLRWARVDAAAGNQVDVHYTIVGRGDCSALGRVAVTESAEEVVITVFVGPLPGADCRGAQPQLAASILTTVALAKPLGGRKIRDGAAG